MQHADRVVRMFQSLLMNVGVACRSPVGQLRLPCSADDCAPPRGPPVRAATTTVQPSWSPYEIVLIQWLLLMLQCASVSSSLDDFEWLPLDMVPILFFPGFMRIVYELPLPLKKFHLLDQNRRRPTRRLPG